MALFSSKAKSSTKSLSATADNSDKFSGLSDINVEIGNNQGRAGVKVFSTRNGFNAEEVSQVIETANQNSSDVIAQQSTLIDAASRIAQFASGAQTETGSLISKLAIPLIIAFVIWLVFKK